MSLLAERAAEETRRAQRAWLTGARKDLVVVPSQSDVDRAVESRVAFETLLLAQSVESECEHGRCRFDTTPECGCFTELPTPVPTPARPVQAPGITTEEARIMSATAAAPYGVKADGTPRKRPAPSAETLRKSHATSARNRSRPAINPEEARKVLTFDKLLFDTKAELRRQDREVQIQAGVVEAEQRKLADLTAKRDRVREAHAALAAAVHDGMGVS